MPSAERRPGDVRPLTAAKRCALVRSALGSMVYRLDAAAVALIAADCAALELDGPATFARAMLWRDACRQALDACQPLPLALEGGADAADVAAAAAALARPDVTPDAAAGAA